MSIIRRVAKNTTALFTAHIVGSILAFILSILIARTLGVSIFGKYSFVMAISALIAILSDLGYNTLLIRDVSRNKLQANKYITNIIFIRSFLNIFLFLSLVAVINLIGYPNDLKNVIYLFSGFILLTSFAKIFQSIYIAFEEMEYYSLTIILTEVIGFSLSILILLLGFGLIGLGFVLIYKGIFDVILSFFICKKKFIKLKLELDYTFWRRTIKIALSLGAASIFSLLYIRVDTVMLSAMKGDAVVGWYNAAYNLILGLKPISLLLMSGLLPMMSVYFVTSKNKLKLIFEKAFRYLFILGLPISVGIFMISDKIILLLYGQQYINSIIALRILAWDVLLIFLIQCISYLLISIDKQNKIAMAFGVTVIINIILNFILIPNFSYAGSGFATIISEFILLCMCYYIASLTIHSKSLHKIMIRPLIACGAMAIFIYFYNNINLVFLIILSSLIYFLILYFIKGILKDDIFILKNLMTRHTK